MRSIADLRAGESGVILSVTGPHALRLMAMGFTPDTPVALRMRAPAGDPLLIALRGYSLIIRRRDAAEIHLK